MAARPPPVTEPSKIVVHEVEEDVEEAPKQDDPFVIHKCLEIIYQLLQDMSIRTLNATLRTLFDELVLPSIQNLSSEIRKSAVVTMGVCCLRDISLTRQHLLLLFQIGHLDQGRDSPNYS
jgi:hypothetical protein